MEETLVLTEEWDKTFPKSDKVNHSKITFHNRYGITLAADMYIPKGAEGKLPAIAVCGPFGAVKEQSSGLYAQTMAEKGFLTIAFDPSFTGESGGQPRYMASPDINTEDFQAAVDFLSVRENVDKEKIGIIGICGWGGMAVNAAAIDTRIKATVALTMYDMARVGAKGYFDLEDREEVRYEKRKVLNEQRLVDYQNGTYALGGGVVDPLPEDAPFFVKDYYDYYKTDRGYHKRSLNSNGGWNVTGCQSFMNMPVLQYASEIRSAVLLIHGEKAHSCYFSRDTYKLLKGSNKELMIIPDAVHTDLYDQTDIIPFDKMVNFFNEAFGPQVECTEAEAFCTAADCGEDHGGFFGKGDPNMAFAQYFSGNSYLKVLTNPNETVGIFNVTFEPGCRNNWHIHHAEKGGGQILICVDGEGWYQAEGEEARSLKHGDVVTIPAGVKHWHGAKAGCWFSHLALECPGENTSTEWLEAVTDTF